MGGLLSCKPIRVTWGTLSGAMAASLLAACSPSESDQAVRNEGPTAAGEPAGNLLTQPNMVETSSPEIANSAEASLREARRTGAGAPQSRTPGRTGGEAATDVAGRAHQERDDDR